MDNRITTVIVILVVVICGWFMYTNYKKEAFGTPLRDKIHVIIDGFGRTLNKSFQSPRQDGYGSTCALVPCPRGYDDDLVCWNCCNYH